MSGRSAARGQAIGALFHELQLQRKARVIHLLGGADRFLVKDGARSVPFISGMTKREMQGQQGRQGSKKPKTPKG
jgi:hypothetical protein